VSVLIGQVLDDTVQLHLWVMSCRVLQREMEFAMFDALVEQCQEHGIGKIVGIYIPSKKNSIVAEHYRKLGFSPMDGNSKGHEYWCYDVPLNYSPRNCHIRRTSVPSSDSVPATSGV
jgi:predicted enzyme involved in methoxymalonyl-ACP biosynthesis